MRIFQRNIIILIILGLIGGGIFWYFFQRPEEKFPQLELKKPSNMKIESPAFSNNQPIPAEYTCDGKDVNPPLKISEVPEETKSLVLIVDDPDAPGGTWVHWTLWNIDPKITEIPENSVPGGTVEGRTDFGKPGYGGPCPPSGIHHYHFKLYALDTMLKLNSSSKKKEVEKSMEGHILDWVELIGLYQR